VEDEFGAEGQDNVVLVLAVIVREQDAPPCVSGRTRPSLGRTNDRVHHRAPSNNTMKLWSQFLVTQ
jgi:hypothetical protein